MFFEVPGRSNIDQNSIKKSLSKRPQDSIENHRFSKPRGLPKPERRENGKRFCKFSFHVKAIFSARWSGLRSLRSLRQNPFAKPSVSQPFLQRFEHLRRLKNQAPMQARTYLFTLSSDWEETETSFAFSWGFGRFRNPKNASGAILGSTWDGPGVHFEAILDHFWAPKSILVAKPVPGVISEADWDCFWRVSDTLGGSKMELPCRREANFAIQARIETASINFDRLGIIFGHFGSFWGSFLQLGS